LETLSVILKSLPGRTTDKTPPRLPSFLPRSKVKYTSGPSGQTWRDTSTGHLPLHQAFQVHVGGAGIYCVHRTQATSGQSEQNFRPMVGPAAASAVLYRQVCGHLAAYRRPIERGRRHLVPAASSSPSSTAGGERQLCREGGPCRRPGSYFSCCQLSGSRTDVASQFAASQCSRVGGGAG
jgi:hypothetical protein